MSSTIPAGGSANLLLTFDNPTWQKLRYELIVQVNAGFSEAAASILAFRTAATNLQDDERSV